MNITSLSSDPSGLLQPPIKWEQLPATVQESIQKLPSFQWQKAIDQFAADLYWFKVRQAHEKFLDRLQYLSCNGHFEKHKQLLTWHHFTIYPNQGSGIRPKPVFNLQDSVIVDGMIGKIVGIYWKMWHFTGWAYLVEWDERTGDGNYYSEEDITTYDLPELSIDQNHKV